MDEKWGHFSKPWGPEEIKQHKWRWTQNTVSPQHHSLKVIRELNLLWVSLVYLQLFISVTQTSQTFWLCLTSGTFVAYTKHTKQGQELPNFQRRSCPLSSSYTLETIYTPYIHLSDMQWHFNTIFTIWCYDKMLYLIFKDYRFFTVKYLVI